MTITATKPKEFELDADQEMNLICALADNGELMRDLIENYLNDLSSEELEEVYGFYF